SLGTNCSLNCDYCYLKFSKTPSLPVLYQNFDKFEEEIEHLFSSSEEKFFYFNYGETTDILLSKQHFDLCCESIHLISKLAVKYNKSCFIELRTKTQNIINFGKQLSHPGVFVIYTSTLSTQQIIDNFEHGASSLDQRIESLFYAEKLGFLTGVRFEPIILYPVLGIYYKDVVDAVKNVIENYKILIQKVFQRINFQNFHSLILSCLRLTRKQFKVLLKKRSKLCNFEMFLCVDKKYRYSRPIRVTIYKELIEYIKRFYPQVNKKILLSFEFEYIWKDCKLELQTLPEISQKMFRLLK
ncbi:MAG: hypothetical protein NZ839_00630, partial [Endomicrobia bacterium]|nr:hypothetical protein [Endomicrobiia bacterium]